MIRTTLIVALVTLCISCTTRPPEADNVARADTLVIDLGQIATGQDGRCFANVMTQDRVERVTEQVVTVPEIRDANGAVSQPAIVRNQTRDRIVQGGPTGETFETLCPPQYTAELVSTLQRALQARGAYLGPITGALDLQTTAAIRQYQAPQGHNSPLLDIQVARQLGVVALTAEQLNAD